MQPCRARQNIKCSCTVTGAPVAAYLGVCHPSFGCATRGMYSKCLLLLPFTGRQFSEREWNRVFPGHFYLFPVIVFQIHFILTLKMFIFKYSQVFFHRSFSGSFWFLRLLLFTHILCFRECKIRHTVKKSFKCLYFNDGDL